VAGRKDQLTPQLKQVLNGVVGKGSFVSDHPADTLSDKREALARQRLAKDLPYYRDLGLSQEDVVDLVRELFDS
jgi:DNA-binding transcriptional regulator YhcF (GntR family)